MLKRDLPAWFVVPAQPVEREKPPTGPEWIHEIKHDGYRMIVRRDGDNVRLYSREAIDWSGRVPAIAMALRCSRPGRGSGPGRAAARRHPSRHAD
jgi:ATP-dependent DNA ligase